MSIIAAAVIVAAQALGPAGTVPDEPFPLNDDYRSDYQAAKTCKGKPADTDAVKMGDKAIYEVKGKKVTVLLDEYARRFLIDYCPE